MLVKQLYSAVCFFDTVASVYIEIIFMMFLLFVFLFYLYVFIVFIVAVLKHTSNNEMFLVWKKPAE